VATAADLSEVAGRLRRALTTADGGALGALLAEEVEWLGARGGACQGRGEVLAAARLLLDAGRIRVVEVRVIGAGVLVEMDLLPGQADASERWLGIVLADESGRIVRMQDYESPEVAVHDLETLAAASAAPGGPAPTGTVVVDLVPFVHVADVGASVAFYRLLGLEVRDTYEHGGRLQWASVASERATLMLASAGEPVEPRHQAVLFYLYTHDLAGLRAHLLHSGIQTGEILDGSPGPRHEMRVTDPDGYCLMVAQIEEHERPASPDRVPRVHHRSSRPVDPARAMMTGGDR
jgi:hypothetical protein